MITPIQGQKVEVTMEIKIKSLKFDADQKLLDYVEKKVKKLDRFHDGILTADVNLTLLREPDNKDVKLQVHVPGEEMIIERNSKSFEEAITDCVDAMKEKLTRAKEKRNEA
jgi:putative sigma-54 modulation protein